MGIRATKKPAQQGTTTVVAARAGSLPGGLAERHPAAAQMRALQQMANGSSRQRLQRAAQEKALAGAAPPVQAKLMIRAGEGNEEVDEQLGNDTSNGDPYVLQVLTYLKRLADPYGDTLGLAGDGDNKEVTIDDLVGDQQASAGYTLLRRVIRSKHMVDIDPWTDEPMNTVVDQAIPAAKNVSKGTGSKVSFPMKPIPNTLVQEGDQVVDRATPMDIALGHELIHADHAQRGVWSGDDKTLKHLYTGHGRGDFAVQEEIDTVGLQGQAGGDNITENDLRRQQGLPERVSYHAPDRYDRLAAEALRQQGVAAKKRIADALSSDNWDYYKTLCLGGYLYQKPNYFALGNTLKDDYNTILADAVTLASEAVPAEQIRQAQAIAGLVDDLADAVEMAYAGGGVCLPEERVPKAAVYTKRLGDIFAGVIKKMMGIKGLVG